MEEELKKIKKLYGENMMKLCRDLFPTILEEPGRLLNILESRFNISKDLYEDIVSNNLTNSFKNYIYTLFNKKEEETVKEINTPEVLLDKAGYTLYECKNEADIQSFRHYYYRKNETPIYEGGRPEHYEGEELCTFNGGRLERCHVFFAVKKNVDNIKRKDFNEPRREDDYGVSVLSIQFSRGKVNTLSIKNRYNHTVDNPDATFSNNLDNIIPGLTSAFESYYNLNINSNESKDFEIPGYVLANDNKYYKYNYEINNVYYCPENIIIVNFDPFFYYHNNKESYIVIDYFILDLKEKTIKIYDYVNDAFVDDLTNIKDIKINNKDNKEKEIIITKENGEDAIITIDRFSRIIEYKNNYVKSIDDGFMHANTSLRTLELSEVETIGNKFLNVNNSLIDIKLPIVEEIGNGFLKYNELLNELDLTKLKFIGDDFLYSNNSLISINFPNLKRIGSGFLLYNNSLLSVELPNVVFIKRDFLYDNNTLKNLKLPNVEVVGHAFLSGNNVLTSLEMPKLKQVGIAFVQSNKSLTHVVLPKNFIQIDDMFVEKHLSAITYVEDEEIDNAKSNRM